MLKKLDINNVSSTLVDVMVCMLYVYKTKTNGLVAPSLMCYIPFQISLLVVVVTLTFLCTGLYVTTGVST